MREQDGRRLRRLLQNLREWFVESGIRRRRMAQNPAAAAVEQASRALALRRQRHLCGSASHCAGRAARRSNQPCAVSRRNSNSADTVAERNVCFRRHRRRKDGLLGGNSARSYQLGEEHCVGRNARLAARTVGAPCGTRGGHTSRVGRRPSRARTTALCACSALTAIFACGRQHLRLIKRT